MGFFVQLYSGSQDVNWYSMSHLLSAIAELLVNSNLPTLILLPNTLCYWLSVLQFVCTVFKLVPWSFLLNCLIV